MAPGKSGKVLAQNKGIGILKRGLSDGVTVAQLPLEEFVMVRIHVGQPLFFSSGRSSTLKTFLGHAIVCECKQLN